VFVSILTSLSIGLLASAGPCVLPLYPGFLAYLQQGQKSRYFWCLFVLLGMLTFGRADYPDIRNLFKSLIKLSYE